YGTSLRSISMGYADRLSSGGASAAVGAARHRQWRGSCFLGLCKGQQGPADEARPHYPPSDTFRPSPRRGHLQRRYAEDPAPVSQIFYLNSVSSRRRKAASAEI